MKQLSLPTQWTLLEDTNGIISAVSSKYKGFVVEDILLYLEQEPKTARLHLNKHEYELEVDKDFFKNLERDLWFLAYNRFGDVKFINPTHEQEPTHPI